tara:strand:+ start:358 stop:498 length:141 start_codon:yes stop_codon:yes gene_type:complete
VFLPELDELGFCLELEPRIAYYYFASFDDVLSGLFLLLDDYLSDIF